MVELNSKAIKTLQSRKVKRNSKKISYNQVRMQRRRQIRHKSLKNQIRHIRQINLKQKITNRQLKANQSDLGIQTMSMINLKMNSKLNI